MIKGARAKVPPAKDYSGMGLHKRRSTFLEGREREGNESALSAEVEQLPNEVGQDVSAKRSVGT